MQPRSCSTGDTSLDIPSTTTSTMYAGCCAGTRLISGAVWSMSTLSDTLYHTVYTTRVPSISHKHTIYMSITVKSPDGRYLVCPMKTRSMVSHSYPSTWSWVYHWSIDCEHMFLCPGSSLRFLSFSVRQPIRMLRSVPVSPSYRSTGSSSSRQVSFCSSRPWSLLWTYWGSAFFRALHSHDSVAANELNTLVNRLVPSFISRTSERRLHPHTRTRPTHHVCTVLSWPTGGPSPPDRRQAGLVGETPGKGLLGWRVCTARSQSPINPTSPRHTSLDASQTTLTTIQNVLRDVATPPSPDDILPCLPKAPSTSENNRTDYHRGERH